MLHELRESGVALIAEAKVKSIEDRTVAYEVAGHDDRILVPADSVILATGLAANPSVAQTLSSTGVPLREIGDVGGVGYLEGAMHDGFHAALSL